MYVTKPKFTETRRPPCSICGLPSYSRDGVHPQCSVRRADAILRAALIAAEAENPAPPAKSPWGR